MMAKPLKEKGLVELRAFQLRVHRQYGLGRISGNDFQNLHDRVTDLLAYVEEMEELEEQGEDL
ncbi:hypothetical protein SEA_WOLLYPOG_47 [Arthrobacter phage Wollypog]|uniref:Uncharacterized protein n=1 Tax=Arthrobacter phage Wollypog TaxID=2790985 RepID=A0A7T3N3I4_9CAUD|nr:hypothetical protein PP291_gp47 [Arthrobacter phage Wollypog]QPX62599.1 hypothetical protein SEA_WOLLYPOG_47 [Arthrobacter phage Wollypog]